MVCEIGLSAAAHSGFLALDAVPRVVDATT